MRYAAFFRGINVGGNHQVKMDDLRQLFLDCGFQNVQTVIQSGNVLFEADRDPASLPGMISRAFAERFGFQSNAAVRSGRELGEILAALPFSPDEIGQAEAANPDVEHVYVFLSNRAVDPDAAEALRQTYAGPDRLVAEKREYYLLCRQSIRVSKPAAALNKLDASLTSRNLNTMRKIHALLNAQG
jgi:uncharacterized protein (DUF1697 family)